MNTAALMAAIYLWALTPRSGGAGDILALHRWTDAESGRIPLCFYSGGEGSLDGRDFIWSADKDSVTLRFMPDSPIGAENELKLLTNRDGMMLRGGDELYIPGEAFTEEDEAAALGQEIAEYARQFEGYDYHYGGKTPESGFDCSGLVYYVYSQFGYALDRVAADQAKNGEAVEPDLMRAGDIICFKSGSYVSHVGIYLGGGQFIHAESSATGVVIGELSGYYKTRGFDVRRIVGAEKEG